MMDHRIEKLSQLAIDHSAVDKELYSRYKVKRGLRDISGKGVVTGLTKIGEIKAYIIDENEQIPIPGKLYYRGVSINKLVRGFLAEDRPGFEETLHLLMFGSLPTREGLADLQDQLAYYRTLPPHFVNDMMLRAPSRDIMNVMARSVLSLYSYDEDADDLSLANVLRQSLQLVAQFPLLAVYGYQAYLHYHEYKSLILHGPHPDLGTAENILYMLRTDHQYTHTEAKLLDLALVLYAEHGGGDNSTFTTHLVTSSGTDTYSAIAASISALKGPRHGGATRKVAGMFDDMKQQIDDWTDEAKISSYLEKLLNKEAYDRTGYIYGVGHAVYSVSDPRAVLLREQVKTLASEKGLDEEFELYSRIERLAPQVIAANRTMYKGVSINVDFYAGFVFRMLGIPEELYAPIYACGRVAGWCAHRIEELTIGGKIIRPAYRNVEPRRSYVPMDKRES